MLLPQPLTLLSRNETVGVIERRRYESISPELSTSISVKAVRAEESITHNADALRCENMRPFYKTPVCGMP